MTDSILKHEGGVFSMERYKKIMKYNDKIGEEQALKFYIIIDKNIM